VLQSAKKVDFTKKNEHLDLTTEDMDFSIKVGSRGPKLVYNLSINQYK
jgi:hypothetical protein